MSLSLASLICQRGKRRENIPDSEGDLMRMDQMKRSGVSVSNASKCYLTRNPPDLLAYTYY